MKATATETIGLCITTVGIALMPVGYYADPRIYFVAFVVVVIGLVLMLSPRLRS